MKLDKEIKEKVVETIGDKVIEEKVNESRDMILNYQDGIKPKKISAKDRVSKKEIKRLLNNAKTKTEKTTIAMFFISLFKKFQFRKYRNRNKKLLTHRKGV